MKILYHGRVSIDALLSAGRNTVEEKNLSVAKSPCPGHPSMPTWCSVPGSMGSLLSLRHKVCAQA